MAQSLILGYDVPMNTNFLQSPEWGKFQEQTGVKTRFFEVLGNQVQALIHPTALGDFWYVAHADISLEACNQLVTKAKAEKNVLFIRIEPQTQLAILPKGARIVKNRQPAETVLLDLIKPVEEIFANMHQKTRYSIRQAEGKDLQISWEKNSNIFHELLTETAARDNFNPHPQEYYAKMLACPLAEQITIFLENKPLASAIFVGYQKTFTYLHSASSSEHRDAMASYLIQWTAIQHAKEKGFTIYDFWGVAPEGDENHSLAGVTRFKIRFGGMRYTFGQAFEVPIKTLKYRLFNFLKKLRV